MCPPLLVAAVVIAAAGAAAAIAANAIGDAAARGDHEEAMRLRKEAAQKYSAVEMAQIDKILAQKLGPTELAAMNIDPTGREAQLSALEKFRTLMNNNGQDAQSRMAFMKAQAEAGRLDSGFQGRMQQQMARTGMAGSGLDYASQMQAQQGALQRAAEMQTQAAADAANRSFGAAQQVAGLGGSIRGQDYQQASDRAKAQDEINRWNAEQLDATARYNNYIEQQKFNNRMSQLQGETGQVIGMANANEAEAARTRAYAAQQGTAIQEGANGIAGGLVGLNNAGATGGAKPAPAGYVATATEADAFSGVPTVTDYRSRFR